MRLTGKIAVISGGTGGIGAATAQRFVEEGARVVIADLADPGGLAKRIGARFYRLDVTSEAQWSALAETVAATEGVADILVNAAGVEGDLADSSPLGSYDNWRRVLNINLDGTFLGVRAFLPGMLKKGAGSIINISSLVSHISTGLSAPYGASKAAVWQFSRSVAEFGAMNGAKVRCNSVHPGMIRSRMTNSIIEQISALTGSTEEDAEIAALRSVPFGARGEPLDVAHLLVYLASDESAYVTGSEFKVDGGWSLGALRPPS